MSKGNESLEEMLKQMGNYKLEEEVEYVMDGDKWCARQIGFTDMVEYPVGFGDTQEEALENLRKEME